jgi:hypothetical protein
MKVKLWFNNCFACHTNVAGFAYCHINVAAEVFFSGICPCWLVVVKVSLNHKFPAGIMNIELSDVSHQLVKQIYSLKRNTLQVFSRINADENFYTHIIHIIFA